MEIAGKKVGQGQTFIIAEVGSNHKGDIQCAKEHIDAAAETGVDAIKFQSLNLRKLWHMPSKEIRELHSQIDFPEDWHLELLEYANCRGLLFSSSPTYLDAVRIMDDIGVPFFKIASAQAGTFPQLVHKVASTGKPTFFSSGIASYEQISSVIKIFQGEGNRNYAIFHCNSVYPAPANIVHLKRMKTFRDMFKCPVGFSDHTDGITVALAAIALGADMLEKHFRLDSILDSPDAPFSLTPSQFTYMVKNIRIVEVACGNKDRLDLEASEASFRETIRYRLVLRCDKGEGEELSATDFDYLRNRKGIDVNQESLVLSHFVLSHTVKSGSLLHWSDLKGKV
ncbi:pseudaminic acid synthase [cyanobiont of Ornithocercus magnificus]|nr:pseudaminic acid synthase [cyanobiont of Ornithocercus magnificus]